MAPPVSSALRALIGALVALSIGVSATTFPLPIPTRPTTFPLSRPSAVGEVVAWGNNDFGQTSVPIDLTNVVAISAHANHSLALKADGKVVGWGQNTFGQNDVPLELSNVVAISDGGTHSVALKADGNVVVWGSNDFMQKLLPPSSLSQVVAIAAGGGHTLALTRDGRVVAWGYNNDGETNVPPDVTNIVAIAAGTPNGEGYGMAIQANSEVPKFWGANMSFFNAYNTTGLCFIAGTYWPVGLRRDGIVYGMSSGIGMPLGFRAVAVAAGYYHTIALAGDGTVAAWGNNSVGQLDVPPRLRGVIAVAAGERHSLALKLPTPPIPTTARASAQIVNGFIVALNVIDGGEGYAVSPQVTITSGGGSGATAIAQISKGIVTGFTITNAGIGYTSQPTVTIDPPPFLPKLSIATSRVGVTMQVVPGKRYQLESSNDLPNFGPVGGPFVADKDTILQEFIVSETGQYFRIVEVP